MTDKDIINNLNINSNIDLTDNSYKDLDIELIIREAVKYVVNKHNMPRDLKRVLCYYGIIDHFYPTTGGSDSIELGETVLSEKDSNPPDSVSRARSRRQVSNSTAETRSCQEASGTQDSVEAGAVGRGG
jgi:hypothetical protein